MKMSWIRKLVINGKHIKTTDDFHDEVEGFANTEGYGRNLDALYDELSTCDDLIIIEDIEDMKKNLGADGERIINTINEAAENNEDLTVVFR